MDFAIADSVLHFNDSKSGHAGIFSLMGLDVGIHSHIYYCANDTRGYVPALKRTRKSKTKLDNLKGHKEKTRSTLTNW